MLTSTVNECVKKAISDRIVRESIEKRDRDPNITLESIHSKILRRDSNPNSFRMIVRIGFDYLVRIGNIREDILVDVVYYLNKGTGAETFDVKNPVFVPELPNL